MAKNAPITAIGRPIHVRAEPELQAAIDKAAGPKTSRSAWLRALIVQQLKSKGYLAKSWRDETQTRTPEKASRKSATEYPAGIGFRIDNVLRDAIERAAADDDRTPSNFIRRVAVSKLIALKLLPDTFSALHSGSD